MTEHDEDGVNFRLFYFILFYSILGCVLPLQEVALRQSPPSFSVLCYPCHTAPCCPTMSSLQRRFGLPTVECNGRTVSSDTGQYGRLKSCTHGHRAILSYLPLTECTHGHRAILSYLPLTECTHGHRAILSYLPLTECTHGHRAILSYLPLTECTHGHRAILSYLPLTECTHGHRAILSYLPLTECTHGHRAILSYHPLTECTHGHRAILSYLPLTECTHGHRAILSYLPLQCTEVVHTHPCRQCKSRNVSLKILSIRNPGGLHCETYLSSF